METPDRPERSLPSPWTQATPPAPFAPAPAWDEVPDPDAPAARSLTPRTVLRALRRHWWQALLLWGAASVGLVALIYEKVKPTFEATAWLKVEPSNRTPLSPGPSSGESLNLFMATQLRLITAPDVLGRVIANPNVAGTAVIAKARDPEAELTRKLRVVIPPGTNLILISMSSPRPNEAETIVNTVASAYLDTSGSWLDSETRRQIDQLREYKDRYYEEMRRLRGEIELLARKGVQADPQNSPQEKLNTYRMYRQRFDQIDLEIMDAQATSSSLAKLRELAGPAEPEARAPARPSAAQLEELVRQAYQNDPRVASLHAQIDAAKQQLQAALRISSGHDPAVEKYRRDHDTLRRQNDRLWAQMYPELRRRMAAAPPAEPVDPITAQYETARLRLAKLDAEKKEIAEALSKIEIDQRTEGNDSIRAQFANADLVYFSQMYQKVSLALEDAEYQQHGPAKVTLVQKARPTLDPSGSKRLAMMAGAPVGVLAVIVALATLLEVRGARVADPDELSSRLRLGVIGVVPPLPSLVPPKGPKALRDQRRKLEEFVQSLDHLRVTLCAPMASGAGVPARRCVLITSAVGGEGKTTLAAQLAGRCANAGLTTLLVDADLRRPSLGELLEVPEGPGLAEILSGEAQPEEAMVVIGNAGGFHLLPAGSGGHDPSRLLQGERLGQLIARLREAFDVVLIDAPPVLPVPDALLIGRWTDGAVVAVRHDSSRFPLVERAQKRLTSIGVPLLGAVVNGVRPAESNYGAYDYYATAGGRADREAGA